jgi:hypothetical protein
MVANAGQYADRHAAAANTGQRGAWRMMYTLHHALGVRMGKLREAMHVPKAK